MPEPTDRDDCTLAPDCQAGVHMRACASTEELPEIEEIRRVSLKPGDVLVVRLLNRMASRALADMVRVHVGHHFPGHTVLVLDQASTLEVVSPEGS